MSTIQPQSPISLRSSKPDELREQPAREKLSRRGIVANALDRLGVLDRFLWLRARTGAPPLTIFTYHRVAKTRDIAAMGLDPCVVDAEPEMLAEQLELLKSYYDIVSLDEARGFVEQGRQLKNSALITFDDGYADCLEVATPILERAGARAVFFIPTAYPESGKLFWWDRISLLIARARVERATLTYPRVITIEPLRAPLEATMTLCRVVKRTLGLDLGLMFAEIERATGVHLDAAEEREIAKRTMLSFAQIRKLVDLGMSVQSHGHSHRVLNTMTPEEARFDLTTSRRILSEVTGRPVDVIAYPVGYSLDEEQRRVCRKAGFTIGFTNCSGPCSHRKLDPLDVPRVAMDIEHRGARHKLLLLMNEEQPRRIVFEPAGTFVPAV